MLPNQLSVTIDPATTAIHTDEASDHILSVVINFQQVEQSRSDFGLLYSQALIDALTAKSTPIKATIQVLDKQAEDIAGSPTIETKLENAKVDFMKVEGDQSASETKKELNVPESKATEGKAGGKISAACPKAVKKLQPAIFIAKALVKAVSAALAAALLVIAVAFYYNLKPLEDVIELSSRFALLCGFNTFVDCYGTVDKRSFFAGSVNVVAFAMMISDILNIVEDA